MEQTQMPPSSPPRRSWWSRNWMWAAPVGCLAPVLICGGLITVLMITIFGMMKSAEPYTASLAAAQAHPQVQAALGTPIEAGAMVTGEINLENSSGHADLSYSISGPQGEGTVYVAGDKSAGQWTYDTMTVQIEATGERIDLLPPP